MAIITQCMNLASFARSIREKSKNIVTEVYLVIFKNQSFGVVVFPVIIVAY